ncbi:MAG TPA: hypothetical protein VGM47_09455 [Gammaproteobacteria bacterium]|jgi:MYXO-CTERM domain-containing protein
MAIAFSSATPAANTWTAVRSTVAIRSLATNGSTYVGAASNGIWTSTDLKTWTHVDLPADAGARYSDIIWDGSRFIAVGYGVISSSDGSTWSVDSAADGIHAWSAIATNGSVYIVVGGSGIDEILRSTDGRIWSAVQIPSSLRTEPSSSGSSVADLDLTSVATDGSEFIVGGQLDDAAIGFGIDFGMSSTDGIHWTLSTGLGTDGFQSTGSNGGAWGKGTFVSGGAGGVYTSADGSTWTRNLLTDPTDPDEPIWEFNQIRFLNGQFFAAGFTSADTGPNQTAVFKSSDGAHWTSKPVATLGASFFGMSTVTYHSGQYVAAGYQGVYTSSDGSAWQLVFKGPQTVLPGCVITGGGQDVLVGNGAVSSNSATTWPNSASNSTVVGAYGVGCGAYGNGVFVVSPGLGSILYWSTDGKTWAIGNSAVASTTVAVTWDGKKFWTIGLTGSSQPTVQSSTDGKNWFTETIAGIPTGAVPIRFGAPIQGGGLAFLNDRYVAWGSMGATPVLVSSSDGSTWKPATGIPDGTILASVAYGASEYVALGNTADGSTQIFKSKDAVTWTAEKTISSKANWYALIWGNDEFMGVGGDFKTAQADMLESSDGSNWTTSEVANTSAAYDVTWDGTEYLAVTNYDVLVGAPGGSSGSSGSSGGSGSGGGSSSSSSSSSSGGGGGSLGLLGMGILAGLGFLRRRAH